MIQSFRYTFKNLKNTKGFLSSMLIMPIVMVLLLTLTLGYSNTPVIGVVKDNSIKDFSLSTMKTKVIKEKEVDYFLGSLEGTLVIYLNSDGSVKNYYSSIKDNPLISKVEKEIENKDVVFKEKPSVEYSIGIIIFKLITAGGLLATLLIQEKNNKIFVRIRNSSLGLTQHILGKLLSIFFVYSIANIVILGFYRLAGFDFGRSNILEVFIVFNIALLLSFGIYTFIAGLISNEGYIWIISTGILFPLALFSGVLFPIETMPKWMKFIGKFSPQYYLNNMIISEKFSLKTIIVILISSLVLFLIGVNKMKKVK